MYKRVEFCSKCGTCPVVVITDEVVKIGEKDNMVTLLPDQWEDLRQAILGGRL